VQFLDQRIFWRATIFWNFIMIQQLSKAIAEMRLVQFVYKGEIRIVEPHMLARNQQDHLSLSAWWIDGFSRSGAVPNWRQYLLTEISSVEVLTGTFANPRPGYKRDGGSKFHDILAAV
jgi:hypothetical protein